MSYIKNLINGNIEQLRMDVEAALYSKLDAKLDEKRVEVASDIYNEGKCVPCSKQVNESKLEDMDHEDCVEHLMDSKDMSKEEASKECGHIRGAAANAKRERKNSKK